MGPDDKLTVLFVAGMGGLGGPVRRLSTLLGHIGDVHRILIKPRSELLDARLSELGSVDEHIPMSRTARRNSVGALTLMFTVFVRAASRRRPVDVIHANGIVEFALSWPAAFLFGKPVVTWVGNYESPDFVKRYSWLFRSVARRTRWNAVSSTAADVVVDCGLAKQGSVQVVTNIVDPADVAPTSTHPRNSSTRIKVGYLQVARWVKGFDLLAPVIRELSDVHDRVQFLIFTNNGNEPGWSELAGLPSEVVEVRPRTARVGSIYEECDIVFSPSRRESFNRVVAEALAAGTPVVASDLKPVREVIGTAGLLFPVDDVVAAANALRRLIDDPELRDSMSKAGVERSQAWLPGPVAAEFLSQYRSLAKRTSQ